MSRRFLKVRFSAADIVTAALISISLPTYYKLKFMLDGQLALKEALAPTFWTEYLFSTLLAFGLVLAHSRSRGRALFIVATIVGVVAAVLFTYFYYTIVFPFGAPRSFVFDIAILAVISPLLLSGVRDRMLLGEKAAQEALRAEHAEKMALMAQYDALKARLSPHFLFNALNTLADIVEEDPVFAVRFIDRMATVYRYIIEHEHAPTVPLEKEMEAVRALLFVLETRHPGALHVSALLPEEASDYQIVPLALQTLVENALKHNVYNSNQPLVITIRVENEELVVENTINPRQSAPSSRTGLENLRKRLLAITDRPLTFGKEDDRFWARAPMIGVHAR